MEDRRVGVRIVTRKKKRQRRKASINQIPEATKGKGDSDDDEDDVPSIFKRKSPLHVESFRKSQRRSSRVVVDKDDDDNDDDVFTKTLSKMKDTRGRSNVGVKRTSFSSYGQNPHPGSRKK